MLKRVSIQNFKSLKDVTLDLQKVNLLIGPNNSGKTNFLKALEFVSNLNENINYFDESFLFKKERNDPSIYLVFKKSTFWNEEDDYEHYRLSSKINHHFVSEKLSITIGFGLNKEIHTLPYDFHEDFVKKSSNVNLLGLKSELDNIHIYKPDPNELLKPGPIGTGEEIVSADASNLVGFLDLMLGKYRKTVFSRIETDLHTCIPEFDEINLDDSPITADLKKQFGDRTFKRIGLTDGRQNIIYWADELSEGTLYFIALLCIINQPNPPKLLLLEEPEKGIHPRRIREVMNFIRRLVAEKDIQVIMTTHSPLLLDEFAESPEGVFVFDKDDDGATIVKNLQREIIEPANQKNAELGIPLVHYTDALGEYWTIGFLGGVPHETA